jgi:hypothetical protein
VILVATLIVTVAGLLDAIRRFPLSSAEAVAYLAVFALLFLVRVAGQVLVVSRSPRWLPPMSGENWNLVPYRILLPSQIAILALMASIIHGVAGAYGPFGTRRVPVGEALIAAAAIYSLIMWTRYTVRMMHRPDARWFGGAIPVFFHQVLAAFLFTWGLYHYR